MSYTLNYSGGTIILPNGTADTANTSLTLVGRNWTSANIDQGYGQAINQNYLSLLENFAADTAGPANPITGQIWYDATNTVLKFNISTTAVPNWATILSSGGTANMTFGNLTVTGNTDLNNLAVTGNSNFANISVSDTADIGNLTVTGNTVLDNVTTGNITTGANTTPGTITGTWTLTNGSQLNATYADIAEYYLIDALVECGTVVEFGGDSEIRRCDTDMSTRVAGVITTAPAFIMNTSIARDPKAQPIALQGRVPCSVIGKTTKGDLLVSAGDGHARSCARPLPGTIIGKALQEKTTEEAALIEVSVGRT